MGVIKPWAMNALNGAPLYDAPTLRNLNGATLLGGQSAMLPLSGCLDPRALQVDVSSDPLVTVAAGPAVVTTAAGPYVTGLDSAWSANLVARHQTYARIDRVVLEVSDTALLREAQVRIIAGTPTASPAAPALPTTAIALGRINVPNASGGPASVVDERLFTAAQGGIIYVPDQAARLRLGNPATGTVLYVHEMSTGLLWKNSGTAWRALDDDTGWLPIVAGSGVSSGASVRALLGVVYFKGTFTSTAASFTAGTTILGTIPDVARPSVSGTEDSLRRLGGFTSAGIPTDVHGYVTAAGVISAYIPGGLSSYPNRLFPNALSGLLR